MSEKILVVDDDVRLLNGLKRQLSGSFRLTLAEGGEAALERCAAEGPFGVIVSDMRMPGMDGVTLLNKVQTLYPEMVRIMLTGNADVQTAIDAVNVGNIFRFISKPCSPELFSDAVNAALDQHRLIIAERELLQDTLTGSMRVLTDVLSVVNPVAYGRCTRLRRYVNHIVKQLDIAGAWEFELAALLSQLGSMTMPVPLLQKSYKRDHLTPEEEKLIASHPRIAVKLLQNIPRLEVVSEIILRQNEPYWALKAAKREPTWADLGVQILKVAVDLDDLIVRGIPFDAAWRKLQSRLNEYHPEALDALMGLHTVAMQSEVRSVSVDQLQMGMVLREEITDAAGNTLATRGQEITYPLLVTIRNTAETTGVNEPISVQIIGCLVEKGESPVREEKLQSLIASTTK